MKKNILKAALVIGAAFLLQPAAFAQMSSHFEDPNGNNVTGDTIDYWVAIGGSHQTHFDQVNTGPQQLTYKVEKTNTVITPTCTTWFCVYCNGDMGNQQSQCYSFMITLSDPFITDSGAFNQLICDFAAGTSPGITIVRYRFFNVNDANDTAVIWLRYNVTPTGIPESHSALLGEPYPNPASHNFAVAYFFANGNSGTATVTDLSGKVVYTQSLQSQSGTLYIETYAWAKGAYMISLTGENGMGARRKIVVQ